MDRKFFMNLLGISKKECDSMLARHTKLHILDRNDIQDSYNTLQQLDIREVDINECPAILTASATTLKNRHGVLTECSFSQITLKILYKYVTIMNKPVTLIKTYGYIPANVRVAENLAKTIHLEKIPPEASKLEAIASLNELRRFFIDKFLRQKINASDGDLKKIWHSYGRVRHRPIETMSESVDLMKREMNFSNEKILKNGYLLFGDPENMKKILSMDKLAGVDVKEALDRHPKIFMSNHKSILQMVDIIREHGISESAMLKNLLIFTLGPRTVANRIAYLKQIDEFRVLLNHPRIGRLIYYQNKAIHRLNYLKDNKIFCASLNILSSDTESFQRYAQNGIDATKGREIVLMLSNKLNRSLKDTRKYLCRHPNWCHIPLVSISAVFDHLISQGYTQSDIFNNIHILFYPLSEIIKKSEAIESESIHFITHIDWRSLNKSQFLALVLYIIEIDFHFAGDGIWATSFMQNDLSMQDKSDEVQASPPSL
uniref:Uncharacterized protein n=1 Tax=Phlebotomus kandelakii TaxID=1109342 RepID=A0A6B2EBI5_9DIPT